MRLSRRFFRRDKPLFLSLRTCSGVACSQMSREPRLVDTPLPKVTDPLLLSMISELHHATRVEPDPIHMLWGYLVQCHYPNGAGTWFPIGRNIIPGGLLSRKIEKLQGTAIYTVCDEIARTHNMSAEAVSNLSLHVFFDRYLPNFEKKPRKKPHDPRNWI